MKIPTERGRDSVENCQQTLDCQVDMWAKQAGGLRGKGFEGENHTFTYLYFFDLQWELWQTFG